MLWFMLFAAFFFAIQWISDAPTKRIVTVVAWLLFTALFFIYLVLTVSSGHGLNSLFR